jgi:hypothetical protein
MLPTCLPLLQNPELGLSLILAEAVNGAATNVTAMRQAKTIFINFVNFDPPLGRSGIELFF